MSIRNLGTTGDIYIDAKSGERGVKIIQDGAVELYCDNTKQFETAFGGVKVTGILTCTGTVTGTAATIGTGVTINNTGIDAGIGAGICTAKEFYGDGSNLTGIAAGGGDFNTSISGYANYAVTTSMANAYTESAGASYRTIIHSILICNISASEVTVSGMLYGDTAFAHLIPVPAGSSVELLKKPKVLANTNTIKLQASENSALQATISLETQENNDLTGTGTDLTSAATDTDLFTLSGAAVVESVLLTNDDGTNDVKARVAWTDGSNTVQSHLCYDLVVPAQASVELLENPLAMPSGHKLRAQANQADRLEVLTAYKLASS